MMASGRDVRPAEAGDESDADARSLSEIVQRINQSLDAERVFTLVARYAAQLVHGHDARLCTVEGDALVIVGSFGDGDQELGDRIPVASLSAAGHTRNSVTAPLLIGGRMTGALIVSGDALHEFDARDEARLRALADHVAITVENARLYRASERTMRHASILAAAARGLALNVEPCAIYADIARIARDSLDADGVTIYLVNEATDAAEQVHSEGAGAEASRHRTNPFASTAGARVARSGMAEFRSNLREHDVEPMAQRLLDEEIASVALLPLIVEGRPRGVLALRYLTVQAFDDDQRQLLADFSLHAAVAMRNALLIADMERRAVRITEAERRRQEQQRTLATALESMEQAVFICSSSAVIRYANGAAIREYGYTFGEFVGMHARELTIRRSAASVVCDDRHHGSSTGAWVGEQVQRRKDGSEFPAWVTISTIHGPEGEGTGVVVTVRNLVEEQRIAEQLRQSEKLVALGELVAGVAHEVNNPLTGISAFAQLLLEEGLTPEQLDAVRLIKREADRAVGVVRDLLTFARKAEPRTVSIDVNELIEQTLRLCAYGLRTAGVTVKRSLAPDLWRVRGDDRQLQQVLLNLIVNAEHAMSSAEYRTLTIETNNERSHVMIAVSDTGVGMTPDVQRRVFEPFFTTKPEGMGTGLGLSISYGIVHMHGGRLSAESEPGAGATFRIALPAILPGPAPTLPQTTP